MVRTVLAWYLTMATVAAFATGVMPETGIASVELTAEGQELMPAEVSEDATERGDIVAVLETNHGIVVLEFHEDIAPNHVANFKQLVREGFYDGTRFHRCIPNFMIQGGDPYTKTDERDRWGMGNPGYTIDAEFNDRPHKRGSVSMARSQHPNSAGSQFFICVSAAPHLDGQYTNFGTVIQGMAVVDKIVSLPKSSDNSHMPMEPAVITKARLMPRLDALKLTWGSERE